MDRVNSQELGHANIAVGWVPGYTYTPVTVEVKDQSRLVLFSDGVYEFETLTSNSILLTEFYEFLKKNQTKDLEGFQEHLKSHYNTLCFPDDYSMVSIDFEGVLGNAG